MFLINDKVEMALAAVVAEAVAGMVPELTRPVRVVTGKASGDVPEPPLIECSAQAEGEDDPRGSGNVWVSASVAVRSSAVPNEDGTGTGEDPRVENQALVAAVYAGLATTDLAERLGAAVEGLTVFPGSVMWSAPESGRDKNGVWVDVMHLKFYGCGRRLE